MLAPPLATWMAVRYGWRLAFVVTGVLGLAWIPLWNWTARLRPAVPKRPAPPAERGKLLRDRRLWGFVAANALSMVGYSLWTNWTTHYLVDVHRLTLVQAARYAWIPPVVALVGGLAWRMALPAPDAIAACARCAARFRVCLAAAVLSLVTAAIPAAPTRGWAAAGISLSFFAVSAFSVNMYSLPLDVFGRAARPSRISFLVASDGAMRR